MVTGKNISSTERKYTGRKFRHTKKKIKTSGRVIKPIEGKIRPNKRNIWLLAKKI